MPRDSQPFIKRLLGFRLLFVVNAVVLVFLFVSFGREFVRNRQIQGDIADLQAQADALAIRNLEISELHTALQTESYIEREARLKLGMKKPGEQVVVVQRPPAGESGTGEGSPPEEAADPFQQLKDASAEGETVANPAKWWYYFFDHGRFDGLSAYGK